MTEEHGGEKKETASQLFILSEHASFTFTFSFFFFFCTRDSFKNETTSEPQAWFTAVAESVILQLLKFTHSYSNKMHKNEAECKNKKNTNCQTPAGFNTNQYAKL